MPHRVQVAFQKLKRLNMEVENPDQITVLVVEDSRTVRTQLKQFISVLDHVEVVEATTQAEAKAILDQRAAEFFCAIVDLTLPDTRGVEIVTVVQAYAVPVIVLTASIDPAIRQSVLNLRVIDYIIKSGMSAIEDTAYLIGRLRQNHSMKVMIVDDSKTFRRHVLDLLLRYRFTVIEAEDGKMALDLLAKHPDTALLLTDYNMPEMSGIELIRQIRSAHRREDLAIIALSQSGRHDLSAAMLKAGANDYLAKNFLVEEFYCRVVQNANMVHYVRTLQDMANRDYLTRLHNRRHLFHVAETMHAEAKKHGKRLSVAMVDVDHFKRINDQHGHVAGDEALKYIARTLRRAFLREGLVARYGGEEFVCVVRVNNQDEAVSRFESLRAQVEALGFQWNGEPVPITISIGLTTQCTDSFTSMLDLADQAVFRAKAEGRNRIVVLDGEAA